MSTEAEKLRAQHLATQTAQSDKLKNDLEMLKNKKEQMLDADKKRKENLAAQKEELEVFDATELVECMLLGEKAATGGFDYEKKVNDTLKSMGKADKDSTTAGSSADAPDAKFNHNGKTHHLEIKQNSKAMFGQIELHHNGKEWDVSERSKKKYPETHKAIHDSGFLKKVNKQWDKPTGDYDEDLKKGNVYHDHPNADPIKAHYGKDRKTDYIQIGGHGFYHTGKDAAKLGSPELEGKTQFRARMKYRGTDKKTGKKKYGALVVMSLKDAQKSHHDLDAPTQKEWIEDIMNGHQLVETALNPKDPHGDYKAKKKTLLDLSTNKHVDQKAVQQRTLDLEKEYDQYRHVRTNESHAPEAPSIGVHRIGVTVSDPEHPAITQRDTKLQKFVRVTHHDANKAIEVGKKHFAKKGWKVHDGWHAGNVHESLEEAHKIGDKVQITGGSAKGTVGHIGEIRHGLYKGAPKTITVYHGEKEATQVKQHLVKRVTENVDICPKCGGSVCTCQKLEESHVEFRLDHRDKLTGDHKATFAAHDAKVSDTTDKATYIKVPAHKADSFKSAMKGHGAKVELAEGLKHHVAAAAIAVAGALGGHAHAQSAPAHDTAKPAATAQAQDSDKSPHDGAPKAEHKARIDKAEADGSMTRGDANVERMKHGLRPSFGRVRLQQESTSSDAYERAEENKRSADAAKKQGDMFAHHLHMADHHDNMSEWHASKGRHGEADRHAEKSEKHHEEAMKLKEEVAANNVGGGGIAGTQGDAGKKVVMTKEPLKRKPLNKFSFFVSQEHDR